MNHCYIQFIVRDIILEARNTAMNRTDRQVRGRQDYGSFPRPHQPQPDHPLGLCFYTFSALGSWSKDHSSFWSYWDLSCVGLIVCPYSGNGPSLTLFIAPLKGPCFLVRSRLTISSGARAFPPHHCFPTKFLETWQRIIHPSQPAVCWKYHHSTCTNYTWPAT